MAIQMLDKTLVMTQRRSHLVKPVSVDDAVETTVSNIYGEPKADRFDEIIDLLKNQSIYGDEKNITLGAVDVPIEKQIAIDKVSTEGLKSEEYKNTSENKLDKSFILVFSSASFVILFFVILNFIPCSLIFFLKSSS